MNSPKVFRGEEKGKEQNEKALKEAHGAGMMVQILQSLPSRKTRGAWLSTSTWILTQTHSCVRPEEVT